MYLPFLYYLGLTIVYTSYLYPVQRIMHVTNLLVYIVNYAYVLHINLSLTKLMINNVSLILASIRNIYFCN